jgi:antitoxin component YwqK of YwqJK toxin-antitoxin module
MKINKKITGLIVFLLIINNANSFSQIYTAISIDFNKYIYNIKEIIYKDINVYKIIDIKDTLAKNQKALLSDGLYLYFYTEDTTKVLIEIPIKNNKICGNLKHYYLDGKIQYISGYKDDKENGLRRSYYPNGNLNSENHLCNGVPIKYSLYYHENGKLRSKILIKNGLYQGKSIVWDENVKLIRIIWYKKGRMIKELNYTKTENDIMGIP